MFKTKGGGGQSLFEQCSKKLRIWRRWPPLTYQDENEISRRAKAAEQILPELVNIQPEERGRERVRANVRILSKDERHPFSKQRGEKGAS